MSTVEAQVGLSVLQRRTLWWVRGLAAGPVLACLVGVGRTYAADPDPLLLGPVALILPYVAMLILLRECTARRGLQLAEGWSAIIVIILVFLLLNAVGGGMMRNAAFLVLPFTWHAVMFLVARRLRVSLPPEAVPAPETPGVPLADPKLFRGLKLLAGLPTLALMGGLLLSLGEGGPGSLVVLLLLAPYATIALLLLGRKYRKAAALTRIWGALACILITLALLYALATKPVFAFLLVPLLLWHGGMFLEGRRILRSLPAES